jgi:hypothetical protein
MNLTAPVPDAASSIFGPSADWAWRTAGAAPLIIAAFIWWVRWMREERAKDTEQAIDWGMGVAVFLFTAAMAAGAGALVGGLTQLGCVYLIAHVALPPTPGTWAGAVVALFFWGLGQQPKRLAAVHLYEEQPVGGTIPASCSTSASVSANLPACFGR